MLNEKKRQIPVTITPDILTDKNRQTSERMNQPRIDSDMKKGTADAVTTSSTFSTSSSVSSDLDDLSIDFSLVSHIDGVPTSYRDKKVDLRDMKLLVIRNSTTFGKCGHVRSKRKNENSQSRANRRLSFHEECEDNDESDVDSQTYGDYSDSDSMSTLSSVSGVPLCCITSSDANEAFDLIKDTIYSFTNVVRNLLDPSRLSSNEYGNTKSAKKKSERKNA